MAKFSDTELVKIANEHGLATAIRAGLMGACNQTTQNLVNAAEDALMELADHLELTKAPSNV